MHHQLADIIGQTDIYIVDQILKGRYHAEDVILDAGCGSGRNMHWFIHNHYNIFGTDEDESAIHATQQRYPMLSPSKLILAPCDDLPFGDNYFHHIICSAVLHFAENEQHFIYMTEELLRVLKPGGTLFIRMASVFGMENILTVDANGRSILPDGTQCFLLNEYLLNKMMKSDHIQLAEPIKTTIVHGLRCMTTLVLGKN